MLSEVTDEKLQDVKCFIEAEMKVRSESKTTEKVQKLANMIQQIVDLDYTLRVSTDTNAACPTYFLEDKKGTGQYHIIPDYHNYDEYGLSYGYIINKWNGNKKIWEDITNG